MLGQFPVSVRMNAVKANIKHDDVRGTIISGSYIMILGKNSMKRRLLIGIGTDAEAKAI